ncbi:hemerythrin domain-containing protein [Chitinimonas koreensis]|uniref:hemerythrin domain-containing protein n=1 Tax=Chitinimonas koreensis TaxID=356302 RepID=UPI0003FD70C5|nr:hemerythrin domain-containing protein [Chitinimonas koreensis]QNM97742.1 hemerythrin domain-containing protein [Chitinimonas koreensis]
MASPRRFDLYAYIHKALRAQMSHVLVEIGRTDWDDGAERDAGLAAVRDLLGLCHGHLEQENTYIHPVLELIRPRSSLLADSDHKMQAAEIEALFDLCNAIDGGRPSSRAEAGEKLYRALSVFIADNFEHMAYEEREHNRLLWAAYGDDEIRAIHHVMVASIPLEQSMRTLRWMVPNLTPQERTELLLGLRRTAPLDMFNAVMGMLRGLLKAGDWSKLTLALSGLGPAPAANDPGPDTRAVHA